MLWGHLYFGSLHSHCKASSPVPWQMNVSGTPQALCYVCGAYVWWAVCFMAWASVFLPDASRKEGWDVTHKHRKTQCQVFPIPVWIWAASGPSLMEPTRKRKKPARVARGGCFCLGSICWSLACSSAGEQGEGGRHQLLPTVCTFLCSLCPLHYSPWGTHRISKETCLIH